MPAVHVSTPPHPGIVGGSALLGADIGWVLILGLIVCAPLAVLSQYVAKRLTRRDIPMPAATRAQFESFGKGSGEGSSGSGSGGTLTATEAPPSMWTVLTLVITPLVLIMLGTTGETVLPEGHDLRPVLSFIGAPVFALLVALMLAFFLLGIRRGWSLAHVGEVMEAALPPVAIVILVTGAGGVFAKVLTESGVGEALADTLSGTGLPILLLGFVLSVALRVSQGSATVAILTSSGLLNDMITGATTPRSRWRSSRWPSRSERWDCPTSTTRGSGWSPGPWVCRSPTVCGPGRC